MVTRLILAVIVCSSCYWVIQSLLPRSVVAVRISPIIDEFMMENQRTRTQTRQNYVLQRALDDEISANNFAVPVSDTLESKNNPEELTDQIVDYANMIRNDIIFLDNSVETTTRKRGNIKKKNHAIPELPCNCEFERYKIPLGENYFPSKIETRRCIQGTCPPPYRCKATYYNITILKKTSNYHRDDSFFIRVQNDFHSRWIAHKMNVTTACECSRDVSD